MPQVAFDIGNKRGIKQDIPSTGMEAERWIELARLLNDLDLMIKFIKIIYIDNLGFDYIFEVFPFLVSASISKPYIS